MGLVSWSCLPGAGKCSGEFKSHCISIGIGLASANAGSGFQVPSKSSKSLREKERPPINARYYLFFNLPAMIGIDIKVLSTYLPTYLLVILNQVLEATNNHWI